VNALYLASSSLSLILLFRRHTESCCHKPTLLWW
jgi:hypothetical protein